MGPFCASSTSRRSQSAMRFSAAQGPSLKGYPLAVALDNDCQHVAWASPQAVEADEARQLRADGRTQALWGIGRHNRHQGRVAGLAQLPQTSLYP